MLSWASILSGLVKMGSTIVSMINIAHLIQIGEDKQRLKELENEKELATKADGATNTSDDEYIGRVHNKYERSDE